MHFEWSQLAGWHATLILHMKSPKGYKIKIVAATFINMNE